MRSLSPIPESTLIPIIIPAVSQVVVASKQRVNYRTVQDMFVPEDEPREDPVPASLGIELAGGRLPGVG